MRGLRTLSASLVLAGLLAACQDTPPTAPETNVGPEALDDFRATFVSVDGTWLLLTPTGLDFGPVATGTASPPQVAEVSNVGTSPITLSMAGGAPPAPFNGAQNCQGTTLQPGESCQIIFGFSPTAEGPATGASSFTLNGQPFSVQLQGVGTGHPFRVTPNGLDFGGVALGETSAQQMTHITNVGASPVTISMAGGAPGAPFGAAQNCQGMTLQPGESCQLVFAFTPAMVGLATGASSFTINGQPFSVHLEGTGLSSSLLAVEFLPPLKPGRSFVAGATIPVKFALLDENGMRIPDADALSLAGACAVTVSFSGGDPDPNCARYEPDDDHFMFLLRLPPALPPGTYTIAVTVHSGQLTLGTGSIQVQIRNPRM